MLQKAVRRALKVAPTDMSVLVRGESGTGKEFFPQVIHAWSRRKHARYIAVNCGAIPEGTIDSELFGHEKGAFTGADRAHKGYFEEADGGTVFLDEVAELPLTTQARLLRVLESGEFLKVGSSQPQKTNIRIVAATNVDLRQAVAQGRFREDLYYRLASVEIHVPPLRERGGDLMLLSRKFAGDFAEQYSLRPVVFGQSAADAMMRYRWPGNIRQLRNVISQIALFEEGKELEAAQVYDYLPSEASTASPVKYDGDTPAHGSGSRYEREREMLFNLIFRLQGEIDQLRRRVDGNETDTTAARGAKRALPPGLPEYRPDVTDVRAVEADQTPPAPLERPKTLED
ncbi:MAG: sigma-54 dependent transcriptional regulator, partial [Muribaculaceae bacterium]|nr:sigma-54 dependent transcriptional regulator [Muribaculaceae bacterium]